MDKQIQRFLKRKQVLLVLGKEYSLSQLQHTRLMRFFQKYGHEKKCEEWFKTVSYMIKYDLSNIVGRIRRLKQMSASPNDYSLILRYGKQWKDHKANISQKRTAHFKNRLDYWVDRGFSICSAKEQIEKVQRDRSLRSPVTKGGTSEYSCRSSLFWIKKGFSESEAAKQVTRVQRREKSPQTIAKWLDTLNSKSNEEKNLINLKRGHSVESFVAKGHSIEKSIQLSKEYYSKRNNFSKSSQSFFILLENFFNSEDVYFKTKNYEKQFFGKCVDFYDAKSQTVVEYYGDLWHRNPSKYHADFVCYGKTSSEIWEIDKRRIEQISVHPQVKTVIIVWESEVMKNPHAAALKLIQDIKNGN